MTAQQILRKEIIDALPTYKVYDVDTPINELQRGKFIKIVQYQKSQTDMAKDCYSWAVNLQLDLYYINELGFYSTSKVDEIEEYLRGVFYDLPSVSDIYGITTRENNYDTETHSINRRIVNIIFKMSENVERKSYRD